MANIWRDIGGVVNNIYTSLVPHVKEVETVVIREMQLFKLPPGSRPFIRLAGVSGALGVALGAYGAHVLAHKDGNEKLKEVFDIANKYHFIHTLALLAVPFTRKPLVTGSLLTVGLFLFCGSCYVHSLTGNTAIRKVTPYGGFLLIFAWASMAL